MLRIFAALALAAGISYSANAATPDVNCAALQGSPFMCIKNASIYPITGVQAVNDSAAGQSWIDIPGGPIMPGGTSIVKFPTRSGGCVQFVLVRSATGRTNSFPNVDVCKSTSFTIRGGW